MNACLGDLPSQAIGQSAPFELLATLASMLIVAYLALGFRVWDTYAYICFSCHVDLSLIKPG